MTVSNIGAEVDLTLRQGADFGPMLLSFFAPTGAALNLTGCSLTAQLRKTALGGVFAAFVVAITDPAAGLAQISLPHSVTAKLGAGETVDDVKGQYVWDLRLVDSAGKVSTPLWGDVSVFRAVTR